MPTLHVHLFGKFRVQCDEQMVDGLDSSKVKELFCYLLLHRNRSHPRETLAGLLWGESSPAQSKKYLRQTLWQLQTALNAYIEPLNGRVLLVDPNWVCLNPNINLWLDVAVFEQSFASVQEIASRNLDAHEVQTLHSAVELYQEPLLAGWYQEWCLYERERLQNIYLAMLDKLMEYCEVHDKYEAGLEYGECILHYNRACERTHQRLMRLHCLAGNRSAALRQYDQCVTTLEEELSAHVSKQTQTLYARIQADRLDNTFLARTKANQVPEGTVGQLYDILDRITHLGKALADLQHRVEQLIQTFS